MHGNNGMIQEIDLITYSEWYIKTVVLYIFTSKIIFSFISISILSFVILFFIQF